MHRNNVGRLIAACDIVPEKANELAQKYSTTAYSSADEMLAANKDIDVVAICSPNGLHAPHSIMALKAGNPVLCETPMAL